MHGARIGERGAVVRDIGGGLFELQLQVAEVWRVRQHRLGLEESGVRLLVAVEDARASLLQRGTPARQFAAGLFGVGQRIAGGVQPVLGIAAGLAGIALGLAGLAHDLFGPHQRLFGLAHDTGRLHGLGVELGQAVLLRQPLRGGGRRVGAGRQTVPAPERAVTADQPLAGRELCLETAAVGGLDDADLRQATGKLRRRAHHAGQALHALGQRRIAGLDRALAPMHRGAAVERHIEILTQRRAKRGLVAALDADLLQHRWEEVAARGIEDLGQRARFGLDAL